MKNTVVGHDALSRMFTSLDMTHVMEKVLGYFEAKIDCANVYWLSYEAIPMAKSLAEKALSSENQRQLDSQIFVWNWEQESLNNCLKLAAKSSHLGEKTEVFDAGNVGCSHYLLPCWNIEKTKLLGVLILEAAMDEGNTSSAEYAQAGLDSMARIIQFAYDYRDARSLAYTDDLTGLYNQRYLQRILDREILLSARENKKFSLLFVDVDYFKLINDTNGHFIGSTVLVELGKVIKKGVRETDFAFRYGGDEFVIMLLNTDQTLGQQVAERLRSLVESNVFMVDGIEIRLTVSIGLATYPDHAQSRDQILRMADQAMYFGKYKSRNIVYKAS